MAQRFLLFFIIILSITIISIVQDKRLICSNLITAYYHESPSTMKLTTKFNQLTLIAFFHYVIIFVIILSRVNLHTFGVDAFILPSYSLDLSPSNKSSLLFVNSKQLSHDEIKDVKRLPVVPSAGDQSILPVKSNTTFIFSKIVTLTKKVILPIIAILGSFRLVSKPSFSRLINEFFIQYRYLAAFVVCATKACTADFLVQKKTIKEQTSAEHFEYKRNLAFLFYGGLYQGCVQEYIFNHMYPATFGVGTDFTTVIKIVLFDMLVISPFLCLPIVYIIKGAIYKNTFLFSLKHYLNDIMENGLLTKNWLGESL